MKRPKTATNGGRGTENTESDEEEAMEGVNVEPKKRLMLQKSGRNRMRRGEDDDESEEEEKNQNQKMKGIKESSNKRKTNENDDDDDAEEGDESEAEEEPRRVNDGSRTAGRRALTKHSSISEGSEGEEEVRAGSGKTKFAAAGKKKNERKRGAKDDEEEDDDDDEEEEGRAIEKYRKKPSPKSKSNEIDDSVVCQLSDKRSVSVQVFMGKTLVSIREYYEKDGKKLPTRKGISLTIDQWEALKEGMPDIEAAIMRF